MQVDLKPTDHPTAAPGDGPAPPLDRPTTGVEGPGDGPDADRSLRSGLAEALSFFPYLRPVSRLVAGIVLVSLLASLLRLPFYYVPIILTQHFSDQSWTLARRLAATFGPERYLSVFLVAALACMLAASALAVLRGYWSSLASEHLLYLLRRDTFRRIETLSMKAVYARGAGEFVQRLTRDLYYIRDLFGETFTEMVVSLLQVVVFLAAMFWLDPVLTLVLLPLLALVVPLVRRINRRVERLAGGLQGLNEEILSQLIECIGGYRDIRASGRFDRVAERFEEVLAGAERAGVRTTLWAQFGGALMGASTATVLVLPYLIAAGSLRTVADVGRLITYVGFLSQTLPIFSMLARGASELALATPSLRAVRHLLEPARPGPATAPDVAPVPVPAVAVAVAGAESARLRPEGEPDPPPVSVIRFEGVSLNMGGRWVVEDLTFEVPGRKLSAIIGQSGAGKTTIFHLLLRLVEPTRGTIWIDDRPLAAFSDRQLRRILGFIPQNPFIFNQSIRENLNVALPHANGDDQVLRAVAMAQLGPLIEGRRSEGGLDALAGYMGMRLSAGERQRIALARLLIQDPQVIVCDEYTANIDVKTAGLIEEMMRTRFADRTRVLITHELYSIKGADHIIVLDRGRVERVGTHDELLAHRGLYRDLWESQRLA